MTVLHDATVGTFLQILPSVAGLVDKAETYCRDNGLAEDALLSASLASDMWPFAKQITTVVAHSGGAIVGVREGVFSPDLSPAPTSFAALKQAVNDALTTVRSVKPDELDAIAGRDMLFTFPPDRKLPFTVQDFLLSFTLPNFYFHAATAYGVLRSQGVNVGKLDFLGQLRFKA